jgi:hypothetical protein
MVMPAYSAWPWAKVAEATQDNPHITSADIESLKDIEMSGAGENVAIGLTSNISADEAESRLKMMFSRGIVRAAENVHAAIVTSGCDRGPVAFVAGAYSRPLFGST